MTSLSDLLGGSVPEALLDGTNLAASFDLVHPTGINPATGAPFTFKDYQEDLLKFTFRDPALRHTYGGLDMGLGKSLVGWAVIATVRNPASPDAFKRPILFVVPPSLRTNIVREGAKFYPHLNIHVITTSKPADGETVPTDVDAIVIGDASLKGRMEQEPGSAWKKYVPEAWTAQLAGKVDGLIVDEAHRHKNNSNRARALAHLGGLCPGYKLLLSGTPFPNGRNMEIANQVKILGDGAWEDIGGKGQFFSRYAPKVDSWGGRGSFHAEELNGVMSDTWYFRRLRDDVEDLPAKGRSFVGIEATGKGKRDYLKAEADLVAYLKEEMKNWSFDSRAEALVKLNTLRRLAGVSRAPNVAQHVKEILDEDGDEGGVFIVAEHKDVIDTLMIKLLKYNPVTIRGGMSDKERTEAMDEFNSGEARVLVGQITSAGTGFTLHGDGRNHRVVFAQIPWTPAEVRQAEDRLHRIGQTNEVFVELTGAIIPEAQGGTSIDERLWNTLERKAFSMGQVTDGEGSFLLEEAQSDILDSYR